MSSTSVSLESLHFLLQHMDANRRFEISNRCPSLREFEKSVPLKINSLVLMGNGVMVNDTSYKLGIVRKCKVGEVPRFVATINERGGHPYEVDAYGIKDESDLFTVSPGDVMINQPDEQFIHNEDLTIENLQRLIQDYELEIAHQRGRRRNQNLQTIHQMENRIEDARAKIFDYQSRRDNIPSRYELFFQLTMSNTVDKNQQTTIQRYIHNKKFSQAMKQLTTKFFGRRCSPIHVTDFKFSCLRGVIHLPVGFKIHTEQLAFCTHFATPLRVLAPILHESSYPLNRIEVRLLSNEDATNPIVNTAGFLRIGAMFQNHLQTISAIRNPVVHITITELLGQTPLIEELVEHWIESQRPLGHEYIFDYQYEPCFADEMEDILKKFNGVPVDDENVIIPMSEVTRLKVSYGPFPEFSPSSKWAYKLLTEAIEN